MIAQAFWMLAILEISSSAPQEPQTSTASVASDTPVATPSKTNLLQEFLDILPIQQVKEIGMAHAQSDEAFQAAVLYLQSPEWAGMVSDLRNDPAWVAFKESVKAKGMDLNLLFDHLLHCVNATAANITNVDVVGKVKPSFENYLADVKQNLAIEFIKAGRQFLEKIDKDEDLSKMAEELKNAQFAEEFEKIRQRPAWLKLANKLKEMGVDMGPIFENMKAN